MINYKSTEEIEVIRKGGVILGKAHAEVAKYIKEGISTKFLDGIAEQYICDNGAVPSFKNYNGFPYSLCISLNENVVHGFPSDYVLKDGDIISVDCGVYFDGFHSDSAYTYPVGRSVSLEAIQLLKVTKESLYKGIEKAKYGFRVGDISNAIQSHVRPFGYGVVRELVGHGLGRNLHESPEVPNYGFPNHGPKLNEGLVIAIEPMVNLGTRDVVQEQDGWTIRTKDRKASAHYEHTVGIFKDKTEILTTFKYIEDIFNF